MSRLRRAIRRRLRHGLILMYHRIAGGGTDPWGLCVAPHHFAEHMDVLEDQSTILPLQQFAAALECDKLPRHAVAVTFDDGYADNLSRARPLLERYDVPATFFLATGYVGRHREFWWDELDRLLLQPGCLPERLCLVRGGQESEWTLGDAARYDHEQYRRHRNWRTWDDAPTPRHVLYTELWQRLYAMPEGEKQSVLGELRTWAGTDAAVRPTHRILSGDELLTLARGMRVEIGAHTVWHPALAALPIKAQREEIRQSKAFLEECLGRPVKSFSYPHGERTADTAALVREAGFRWACSTVHARAVPGVDPFELPRLQVLDWDGDEFGSWLSAWQADEQ